MTLPERDAAIEAKAREIAALVPGRPDEVARCAAAALVDFPSAPSHGLGDIAAVESWDRRKVMYAAATLIAEFKDAVELRDGIEGYFQAVEAA